jgi:hypothetical protein
MVGDPLSYQPKDFDRLLLNVRTVALEELEKIAKYSKNKSHALRAAIVILKAELPVSELHCERPEECDTSLDALNKARFYGLMKANEISLISDDEIMRIRASQVILNLEMCDERFVLLCEDRACRAEIERENAGIIKGTEADFNEAVKEYMSIRSIGDSMNFTNALVRKFGSAFAAEVAEQASLRLPSDPSDPSDPS